MDQRAFIMNRLQVMEVAPKRSLGQNFLVAEGVIEHICSQVRSFKPKSIIEIGPGLGSLTEKMIDLKIPLQLIELDREFANYWSKRAAASEHLKMIEDDALQIEWEPIVTHPETVLVSNLPYQIGARVVIDRSMGPVGITRMLLMFQKEVAQRLMAQPRTKEYGFLTVIAQAEWSLRLLLEAGPRDFYPAPNVTSRVLIFERKAHVVDEFFVEFVKKAFSQRRKFMIKSFGEEKEQVLALLKTLGYDEKVRAEEVSVEHYCELVSKMRSTGS
jgi:16S rRNA (adenine1518-N6/adenine1519-N6)-dimethyltransferase